MVKEFLKYNLVGVINTLVGFGIIFILMFLGLSPILSNAIGYLIGSSISFILNSKYTFKQQNLSREVTIYFFLTLLLSYFLNYITLNYALNYFNPYIAQIISGGVYTISSFLIMKFFVFGDNIKNFKILYLIVSLILGVIYYYQIRLDITQTNNKIVINSKIAQNANFFIKTDYKTSNLICNGKKIKIDNSKKHDYFYRGEEFIEIPLKRGVNECRYRNIHNIKPKVTLRDFIILSILLTIPITLFLVSILNRFLNRVDIKPLPLKENSISKFAILIIIGGFIIRVIYFNKFGVMLFQHDWQGHIDLIKYLAQTHSIPLVPNKGWEYPQQPLYYIITAIIYKLSHGNLEYIGYFSLLCSGLFLIYSYRLLNLITQNRYTLYIALLFLSFTPSLIYMSARVNNDVLVSALSVMSMFYIVKSYLNGFKKNFFTALLFTTLLFLTKISTATVELLFFGLLLLNRDYKRQRYIFSIVGIFILSLTLWHLYHPLMEKFYFVNSAEFPKQTIENLNSKYFFSFNFLELLKQGFSHVFGSDEVRYSLLTYQFGTMLFGEFDYKYFITKDPNTLFLMRSIISLSTIYIVGFISYLIFIYRENLIQKLLFGVFIINSILILKFIVDYPSICNSDFRYFVGSWAIIGYIFAKGLTNLFFSRHIKCLIFGVVGLITILEIVFILNLIK